MWFHATNCGVAHFAIPVLYYYNMFCDIFSFRDLLYFLTTYIEARSEIKAVWRFLIKCLKFALIQGLSASWILTEHLGIKVFKT